MTPTYRRVWRSRILCLVTALLAACGIDQGGIQAPGTVSGATGPQTVLVAGPITGFGSVVVNDLRLDSSTAQIVVDGQFGVESDLEIGQVIRAVATESAAGLSALSIEFDESLVGPIEALDVAAGALTVLAQPVVVDAATHFDPPLTGVGDLRSGDTIVVSGLQLPSGEIVATYVGRASSGASLQLTGRISAIDTSISVLGIGGLSVDYSAAVLLQVATGAPQLGDVVEVRGANLAGSTLLATEIRARPFLPGLFTAAATSLTDFETPLAGPVTSSTTLDVNFVGYISAAAVPSTISIADIEVSIGNGTVIVGGTINELAAGQKVQVEGSVSSASKIQAERIKLL